MRLRFTVRTEFQGGRIASPRADNHNKAEAEALVVYIST